jgi:hypothetical protein
MHFRCINITVTALICYPILLKEGLPTFPELSFLDLRIAAIITPAITDSNLGKTRNAK